MTVKLCECGCGEPAPVAKKTDARRGHCKGRPQRFIQGHNWKGVTGPAHPAWKGGRCVGARGYVRVHDPDHPRAYSYGYVDEHILVAEAALGKPLPPGAEVHHVNGDKADNRNKNLVVCQDEAYHRLLHVRQRAQRRLDGGA